VEVNGSLPERCRMDLFNFDGSLRSRAGSPDSGPQSRALGRFLT
jgi:hypothetical protein